MCIKDPRGRTPNNNALYEREHTFISSYTHIYNLTSSSLSLSNSSTSFYLLFFSCLFFITFIDLVSTIIINIQNFN